MADTKYQRETNRFNCLGLDVNRPVDSVKPSKFPYLKNCRSYVAGRIEPRFGLTDIAQVVAGQTPVHSCRRLNDPSTAFDPNPGGVDWTRVVGAGTHVAYGQASFTDLDSGYSGDPLALVPWRPLASPTAFMYIGDRSRMRKVNVGGSLQTIGLPAPSAAPAVALSNSPAYKDVDTFAANSATWTQNPVVGKSDISRTPGGASGSTTTIAQILYDTGTTGWACVQLTSMVGVGRGERLSFATSPETAYVQDVFAGLSGTTATTIAAILYDSGTSGPCSIVLTSPINQIQVNSLIRNTSINENIRVVGRVDNPNGTYSIRASTVGTFAVGNNIEVRPSLRIYLANTHAAGENVSCDAVSMTCNTGTTTFRKAGAMDLSTIASGVPTQPDDFMQISLLVDRPDLISEIKVQLDVDAATNDFTRNYYTRSIRPSDLTPSVRNLQPLVNTAGTIIQRNILDYPAGSSPPPQSQNTTPPPDVIGNTGTSSSYPGSNLGGLPGSSPSAGIPIGGASGLDDRTGSNDIYIENDITTPSNAPNVQSQQLETGDSQWVDVRFSISDLIRVGTDDSRTLQNVASIQILVICTGTVSVSMNSWWIGGGFSPNTNDVTAIPYYYRYRARVLATNVASNWSPATRLSIDAYRQSIAVTPTQFAAPSGTSFTAATDFVLDIERYGGQLTDWHYVGTIANVASPGFIDVYGDDIVAGQPIIGIQDYQPWPILGAPVSGTTGIVAGTSVKDAATNFNTSWAPGTRIIINNQPYTIYRVISTSLLEIVESAGSQSAVAWHIAEPTILAQPLPCLWEWDGTFFACGDPTNPGRLYYSNPNSETTQPTNYLDLTSPSEPLMNGLQYNVRSYVFSSENFIQILKTGDPNQPFRHENIPNGKGLFSRWALTREPSPLIVFLARDGLNMTTGGASTTLSDADLYELFPNEGNIGQDINTVSAPNVVSAQAAFLRLTYYDEFVYFDYADLHGGYATLVLALDLGSVSRGEAPGGWFWDVYTPFVVFHYGEEGSGVHSLLVGTTDSHIYQYTGNSDNGTAIAMQLLTPSLDQGQPRENKLYGDIMLDADTAGLNVTCTPFFNNNATSSAAVTINTATRAISTIPLGSPWVTARNVSLLLTVSISDANKPNFYIWEPRWTFESAPVSALSWEISPTTFGIDNYKHLGIHKIAHVSTTDLTLTWTIDGVAQTPITIPNSGGVYTETIFRVPVYKAKLYKVRLSSTSDFRLDPRDSFIEVKPWASDGPYQQMRIFADYAAIEG